MEKIYKRMLWLSLMIALSVNTVSAQGRLPMDIKPASGGELPTDLPELAEAEPGRFGALMIDCTTYPGPTYNYTEAWLKFTAAKEFGGDYYLLYRRSEGQEGWTLSSDYHFEHDNATTLLEGDTYFRLVLKGGPKDGYISNEVFVPAPKFLNTHVDGWATRGDYDELVVGSNLKVCRVDVRQYGDPNPDRDEHGKSKGYKTYTNEDGCYRYQWYRRNPNTGEMTAIEGATDEDYTTTVDDVGYDIFEIVSGDDAHVSFLQGHSHGSHFRGIIQMPIPSSIAYMDNHGFVLNTKYVIPEPGKNLFLEQYDEETGATVKEALGDAVKELKPGQYQVTMERDKFEDGELSFGTTDQYYLCFLYEMPVYDDNGQVGMKYRPREAQLLCERFLRQLTVKPELNHVATATDVDIIGTWVDGTVKVLTTLTAAEANEGVFNTEVFKGQVKLRAHKTASTLDTYYPNALLWSEATAVEPEANTWEDDWQPTSVTIDLLPAPAAMTGTGVIAGTVTDKGSGGEAATRGEAEAEVFTVFLKETGGAGDIVAETETDDEGNFRFEKVPFGTYQVFVDGVGCTFLGALDVELTAENPAVNNADYVVDGDEVFPAVAPTVSVKLSVKQLAYSSDKNLDFSKVSGVKAYVATGYDKPTGTIWLSRVYDVPAGTGFLMMSEEAKSYDIPTSYKTSSYYKNMFKAALEGATIHTTDGEYTNYYLSSGDEGVGFYKVTKEEGVKLSKNRAYLPIPTVIETVGEAGPKVPVSVSGALQVPYYSDQSLDFTEMEEKGMKAYTATGYDYATGTIWLSRVKKVPALTGVLIMAPKGDYEVPTVSVASVYENMFKGTLVKKTIYTEEDGFINYYLSNGTDGVGFYRVKESGVTLGANRCYLQIPKLEPSAASRGAEASKVNADLNKYGTFGTSDMIGIQLLGSRGSNGDGTTGIQAMDNGKWIIDDAYYNLNGQRVDKPGKGLYIHNGKKVILR